MGIFGIFKRKDSIPDFVKQSGVKCKEFSFEPIDIEQLDRDMKSDTNAITKLTPSNYYASKARYVLAKTYFLPDHSRIMVNLTLYMLDKPQRSTGYYEISFETMKKLCAKFGQHI